MKLLTFCNKVIEYSFYSLFFLVPLAFSGDTSELFELNKMWLTFGLTLIVGLAWGSKIILEKKVQIQRTPLDILILLFLLSQIIASIFTIDHHVSWWGYYSRFNGGLLSMFCYVFLYYAYASNLSWKSLDEKISFSKPFYFTGLGMALVAFLIILGIKGIEPASLQVRPFMMGLGVLATLILFIASFRGPLIYKTLFITFNAGFLTALWGFPAHFGFDPTCQLFQGNFDVSCWTEAFQPMNRTFSTLGQPAWLASYLAMLIPMTIGVALRFSQNKSKVLLYIFSSLAVFFYLSLLFANTRAGFIAFWVANLLFWAVLFLKKQFPQGFTLKAFGLFTLAFFVCNFFFNTPLSFFNTFTLSNMTQQKVQQAPPETISGSSALSPGITDSGNIRLLVWDGAIKTWQNNPIFGTGVETYAFDYYKYKSPEHNLTSEWDYLYNKAHNEYLNYLATTGIFGLGTYLLLLGFFLILVAKWCWKSPTYMAAAKDAPESFDPKNTVVIMGLVAGWFTILITNFFGFSVVIMNIYLFFIPLFVFILMGTLKDGNIFVLPEYMRNKSIPDYINPYQWTAFIIIIIAAVWMAIGLIWYRQADIAYAYGNNLDKTGNFGQATSYLLQASQMVPDEPVYKDELSVNLAALGAGLLSQKETSKGEQIAKTAIAMSDQVVTEHPNNVVYWKNRVRLFYTLSSTDKTNAAAYTDQARIAIDKAKELAPTDAKIAYNQGVLYGQIGRVDEAVPMLEQTIKYKPDYIEAYVALGLFYHQLAVDKNEKVVKPELQQKAVETYEFVLKNLDPKNEDVKKSLTQWRSE